MINENSNDYLLTEKDFKRTKKTSNGKSSLEGGADRMGGGGVWYLDLQCILDIHFYQ